MATFVLVRPNGDLFKIEVKGVPKGKRLQLTATSPNDIEINIDPDNQLANLLDISERFERLWKQYTELQQKVCTVKAKPRRRGVR